MEALPLARHSDPARSAEKCRGIASSAYGAQERGDGVRGAGKKLCDGVVQERGGGGGGGGGAGKNNRRRAKQKQASTLRVFCPLTPRRGVRAVHARVRTKQAPK